MLLFTSCLVILSASWLLIQARFQFNRNSVGVLLPLIGEIFFLFPFIFSPWSRPSLALLIHKNIYNLLNLKRRNRCNYEYKNQRVKDITGIFSLMCIFFSFFFNLMVMFKSCSNINVFVYFSGITARKDRKDDKISIPRNPRTQFDSRLFYFLFFLLTLTTAFTPGFWSDNSEGRCKVQKERKVKGKGKVQKNYGM